MNLQLIKIKANRCFREKLFELVACFRTHIVYTLHPILLLNQICFPFFRGKLHFPLKLVFLSLSFTHTHTHPHSLSYSSFQSHTPSSLFPPNTHMHALFHPIYQVGWNRWRIYGMKLAYNFVSGPPAFASANFYCFSTSSPLPLPGN